MADEVPKDRVKDLRQGPSISQCFLFRQETILCRVKYHNNLPDIAFDPKFLTYPFESSRFVQYAATSLERNHKHELLCETDVGVDVDLIDPDVFAPDPSATLHPDDEKLLEDDDSNALNDRKSRHQRSVAWLRKTEYLSTEHYNKWNKTEKIETKLGHNIKQRFTEEIVYRDRESQISAIQATFAAAKKPIKRHYSKPGVHAVEVLPLLPDFKLWRYPCAQVIFDDDPARKGQSVTEQRAEVNQAVIRGMVDETGDHFVVYFLPTEETKQLRRLDAENHVAFTEGASYEYEKAREYNWNVKNKTMANYEENYFFLETRVRLSKRRKLQSSFGGTSTAALQPPSKMRLIVQHRDFTYEELQAQTARLDMLKHESEDEEEEEQAQNQEEGDEEEEEKERSPENESTANSSTSSPAATQLKAASQPQSESDEARSSQEEDEEHQGSRYGSASKRPATKRPTASSVFSDDDDDDDEEEEGEEGNENEHDDRRSVSSGLSNDSEPPTRPSPHSTRYASKKGRKEASPDDENSESDQEEDARSPSPPPSHQRRKFAPPPSRSAVQSDSDELSSLSD
ncbi:unnamed protein product [Mesocestoides corti]|uniref:RNA polymerase II-associated factor 1 homolog n=1 Tax=Mesocestoides corti TaxID=53468 RepID=A0A158QTU6_MESCO|nr:unnamed protein product [Mesocestoides corti]